MKSFYEQASVYRTHYIKVSKVIFCKSTHRCWRLRPIRLNQIQLIVNRSVSLTLAGHAYWLIARLADAVIEGGAAWLGGVLQVRAWQAGAQASWCSLWFIGAGWTCCKKNRRGERTVTSGTAGWKDWMMDMYKGKLSKKKLRDWNRKTAFYRFMTRLWSYSCLDMKWRKMRQKWQNDLKLSSAS